MTLPLTVPLIWRRSSRAKRLSLRIDPISGNVIVTLPSRTSTQQGAAFVQQNMAWISNALATLPERSPLAHGQSLMLEGQTVTIHHTPNAQRGTWLDQNGLHVSGNAEHTERRVRDFLLTFAKKRLTDAVTHHSQRMQLYPSRLDLRDVKTRWGSCTRQGRIMLSWRLIMPPPEIRDYVVIHELAHLRHFNHGNDFWALVDTFCAKGHPGRLAAERWLRENGVALLRTA